MEISDKSINLFLSNKVIEKIQIKQEDEKILCNHCMRTSSNGIRCMGICVADNDYWIKNYIYIWIIDNYFVKFILSMIREMIFRVKNNLSRISKLAENFHLIDLKYQNRYSKLLFLQRFIKKYFDKLKKAAPRFEWGIA